MANLINDTYFVSGKCAISNIASTTAAGTAIKANVNAYITELEPELLEMLFGEDLYDVYVADPSASIWDGVKALLYNDTTKASLIREYVWYHWMQDHQAVSTQSGDKQASDGQMTQSVNYVKMVNVWNGMVKKIATLYEYMSDNASDFDTWDGGYDFERINIMSI